MSENNEKRNQFKIELYSKDSLVYESIFDGDCYHPITRYSVDIRNQLFSIMKSLKKTLSSTKLNFKYNNIDLLKRYKDEVNKYPIHIKNSINIIQPKNKLFRFVLSMNDSIIVEREFEVVGFNFNSLFSYNLYNTLNQIKEDIINSIRNSDINLMWEDYEIINTYNYNIQQVRELPKTKRKTLLYRIYNKK